MAKQTDRHWADERRCRLLAICPPAVRMVVVEVWADGEECGHHLYPVVALQSYVERRFTKVFYGDDAPSHHGTEEDLLARGWHLTGEEKADTLLIVHDDGFMPFDDPYLGYGASLKPFCCPWPPEEDEARLGPQIRMMQETALRVEKMRQKDKAT